MSPCGAANSAGSPLPASSPRRGPVTMSGSRNGSSPAAPGASTAPWPWSARTSSLCQVAGQPAPQAQFEAGAVEAGGVVLEHAGHPALAGEEAHGVAVADVDEHGVGDSVRQRAVERRRPGVGHQRRRRAGEGGRRVRGGAQARERRRDGGGVVEEVADEPALGHRLLPEREAQHAVGAARRVAVVLHGDGHGGEGRLRAEQAQSRGERRRVQVAARRPRRRRRPAGAAALRPRRPRPPRARRARAPCRGRRRSWRRPTRSPRRRGRRRGAPSSPSSPRRRP